jgi:hypothetical protein
MIAFRFLAFFLAVSLAFSAPAAAGHNTLAPPALDLADGADYPKLDAGLGSGPGLGDAKGQIRRQRLTSNWR